MLCQFLCQLFEHGRVQVADPDSASDGEDEALARVELLRAEAVRAMNFPGGPPAFSIDVALWSSRVFYRACQAAAFRNLPAELLNEFLHEPCPAAELAAQHYSADLVFQFLPDLVKLTSHVSPQDPLVQILKTWANQWPLSSVGIDGVQPVGLPGIVDHPGMLRYYVDRVLMRRDTSRLSDPITRAVVVESLSLYTKKFPAFATALAAPPS